MAKVSAIIPTIAGREELLFKLVTSLPVGVEVIIVPDKDLSLAEKRNIGALQAEGEYLLFIDDDNVLYPDAVDELLKCPGDIKGIVACYDTDVFRIADGGSKRHLLSGFMRGINTNKNILEIDTHPYEVDELANAFMISRKLFFHLGGFDEHKFPIDMDEADLCKRAKDMGGRIMMCPKAICCHKSITYSYIPDFRRPKNAYYMGRNRILFQRKHLCKKWYRRYLVCFMPIFVCAYCMALLYRRKPRMIYHFMKGVIHGLQGRIENNYT